MFRMMGVFAEFEREMIVERVKAGLKRAREEYTDQVWLFPEGFLHYVRHHAVKPPPDFLEHMRKMNFRVP